MNSSSDSAELIAAVRSIISRFYLKDLKAKTHRGLVERALAGLNTGSRLYGYYNVQTEGKSKDGKPTVLKTRKVNPDQAKIVRQIFRWFAKEGRGYREIADLLNRKGKPSARGGKWSGSTIKQMLRNDHYKIGRAHV